MKKIIILLIFYSFHSTAQNNRSQVVLDEKIVFSISIDSLIIASQDLEYNGTEIIRSISEGSIVVTEKDTYNDENSKDFVIVQVKDNFGESISGFEVNYSSIDWKKKQTKKTDENGIVKFDKYGIIYNKNDSASIQIKYLENGKESSESAVVERNSDRITININSEPKTIHKREKYSFEFKKGKLKSIEFPYVDEISIYKKL